MKGLNSIFCCDGIANFYTAILIVISSLCLVWFIKRKQRLNLPPGPLGLPILGYLPFLGKEPFKTLHNLKQRYGNVFSLYLGRTLVVILADYEAVKDVFSRSTTIDRPTTTFNMIPCGVGFSSVNGKEWEEQRRFSVREMGRLGLGKGPWETIIADEVHELVKIISKYKGQPIDVCKLLTSSISNNIASLVLGKKIPFNDPLRDFVDHSIDAMSQFFSQAGMHNYFPTLHSIMVKLNIGDHKKKCDDLIAFYEFLKKEVREYEKHLNERDQNNFVASYLRKMQDEKNNPTSTFHELNLCGNSAALLVGGSDTSRTSLNWLLLAMALYPQIQSKVHEELDSVLGPHFRASWNDRHRLPYTIATIMEGQRWTTIAPLNTSRVAQEDLNVFGYHIPKGTTIIANNWGIHNDTRYWKNPESFIPERFISGGEVLTKPNSYVPFSYGKRNCPGETVAMMELFLYFSALMQDFRVSAPEGETVKLSAKLGLTYQAVEQKLCLIPRQ